MGTIAENVMEAALRCGAGKAALVRGEDIVLSAQFRDVCKTNQCGGYGRCWMCPPEIGEIDALMAEVRRYPMALVYQTVGELEDSFDIEGMFVAAHHHALVSQNIQAEMKQWIHAPFLHLSCGGCHLCDRCAKLDDEPCRRPEDALPSMEGYGIDVYNTVKDSGLHYTNGQNMVTYFGAVLFGE